jgi:hypothetical protein
VLSVDTYSGESTFPKSNYEDYFVPNNHLALYLGWYYSPGLLGVNVSRGWKR